MPQPNLSPAGMQLFGDIPGLGSMLAGQTADQAEELRKRRQQQMLGGEYALGGAGRAALASPAGGLLGGFGLR
jgi:hypothetical protein